MTKSKKRIRGNAPATLKDVAPAAPAQTAKPQSKVSVVTEMVSKGCTLDEIQQRLSVGKIAAASLIGDCRKRGLTIKSETRAVRRFLFLRHPFGHLLCYTLGQRVFASWIFSPRSNHLTTRHRLFPFRKTSSGNRYAHSGLNSLFARTNSLFFCKNSLFG